MAELRAFYSNGGRIELKHLRKQKSLSYKLNKKQLANALFQKNQVVYQKYLAKTPM